MKSPGMFLGLSLIAVPSLLILSGCNKAKGDPKDEAPPPARIVQDVDLTLFSVDHPEQYPLVTATERPTTSELVVTGTVTPDVSRNVPVVSLASGRVMEIKTRLGDTVQKGQLLMTIQEATISPAAIPTYKMALAR